MDTGAECPLLHGNPEKFPWPKVSIDGYGGCSVRVKAVQLSLGIRHSLLREYTVCMSPIPKYVLGIDLLQALWLQTTAGDFCLWVRVAKAILQAVLTILRAVATPKTGDSSEAILVAQGM